MSGPEGKPRGWQRIRQEILDREPVCVRCQSRPSVLADRTTTGSTELHGVCGPCHDDAPSQARRDAARPGRTRPSEQHPGTL